MFFYKHMKKYLVEQFSQTLAWFLTSARRKRSNTLNGLFQGYFKLKEMYPILKVVLKHMKIRDQTRICLALYDFEAQIVLSVCLTFQSA